MSLSDSRTSAPPADRPLVRADLYDVEDGQVRLLASECTRCDTLAFPATPVCPGCQRPPTGVRRLHPTGTVYTSTVVRSRPPNYTGPVPFGLGLVDLPDGLRVVGMLLGHGPDRDEGIDVGADVTAFEIDVAAPEGADALWSYAFRPSGDVRA